MLFFWNWWQEAATISHILHYWVREIQFLSGKTQEILKTGDCGNHYDGLEKALQ